MQYLAKVLRSKSNQAMKSGQLREYILGNHAENDVGRLVLDLFLFFRKVLCKIKASGQHFSFNILVHLDLSIQVDPEIQGLASLPHFLYDFSRNIFLMLYPID